jgi:hypothetical protein
MNRNEHKTAKEIGRDIENGTSLLGSGRESHWSKSVWGKW